MRSLGAALIALAFTWVSLGSISAQQQRTGAGRGSASSGAFKVSCPGSNCDRVRIESVVPWGTDAVGVRSLIASSSKGVYVLSCDEVFDACDANVGSIYEYFEKSGQKRKESYLEGPKNVRYKCKLDVFIPHASAGETMKDIRACEATEGEFAGEIECAKWVRRRLLALGASCPESEAQAACRSFQELVAARDPDVMDDFALRDHVYACFLPREDEFFELGFNDPRPHGWHRPDTYEQASGYSSNSFLFTTASTLNYFKDGVWDKSRMYRDVGRWIYYPMDSSADPDALGVFAAGNAAEYKGNNIQIDGANLSFTDRYKNKVGTETEHSIDVQLSTGRFTERYEVIGSGETADRTSGRCLIISENDTPR